MRNKQSSLFAVFVFGLGACITNSEVGKFHPVKGGEPTGGPAGQPQTPIDTGGGTGGRTFDAGTDAEPTPTPLSVGQKRRLAAGASSTCILTEKNQVLCWGDNSFGQLGIGSAKVVPSSEKPLPVVGLEIGVDAIFGGALAHCALKKDGLVACWGYSFFAQDGESVAAESIRFEPSDVPEFSESLSIALGALFQCAVTADKTTKCWGHNSVGQTAQPVNTPLSRREPTGTPKPTRAVAAAQGGSFACAINTSDGLKCWGANFHGQLGNGTTKNSSDPVDVLGLGERVTSISAGSDHTCAIVSGTVRCWGRNNAGQLGIGGADDQAHMRPQLVDNHLPSGMVALTAGESHTCALSDAGAVYCWGDFRGDDKIWPPMEVIPRNVVEIVAGTRHTCARLKDQRIRCWGSKESNQLGPFAGDGDYIR